MYNTRAKTNKKCFGWIFKIVYNQKKGDVKTLRGGNMLLDNGNTRNGMESSCQVENLT